MTPCLIFTRRNDIKRAFSQCGYDVLSFHDPQEFRVACQKARGAVVYLDLHEDGFRIYEDHLAYLKTRDDLRFALIDGDERYPDPARFFHDGAVDYLTPELLVQGLDCDRLERAQRLNPLDRRLINAEPEECVPYSGLDWEGIEEGKEYMFGMLYAGLDDMAAIQEVMGQEGARKFTDEFRHWLDDHMDAWYGYQWLWSGWGGVYLFPFDGKNYYALEAALECFLNKRIARFSYYERKTTFRFVLHLGAVPFHKRGDTGHIVSDAVNSLFHMAHRENSRDELVLSQEVKPLLPPSLLPFLGKEEIFEGRKLHILKDFN